MTIEELHAHALKLSADEREILAVNLMLSLSQDDHEEVWNREILLRSDAWHAGTAATIDAGLSLADTRAQLRARTSS